MFKPSPTSTSSWTTSRVATEFYRTVLGFEQAANADGTMDYPGVDLASFARDAGFDDGAGVSLDGFAF